ncbi:hypothetical protein SDC9_92830 [bioreactor metagenome]|uniref:Uncharacterized protein n=1 Tax=bioreactor metagenome TaxID=1076179 RepID=A0A644ZZ60_9ZZZZ
MVEEVGPANISKLAIAGGVKESGVALTVNTSLNVSPVSTTLGASTVRLTCATAFSKPSSIEIVITANLNTFKIDPIVICSFISLFKQPYWFTSSSLFAWIAKLWPFPCLPFPVFPSLCSE